MGKYEGNLLLKLAFLSTPGCPEVVRTDGLHPSGGPREMVSRTKVKEQGKSTLDFHASHCLLMLRLYAEEGKKLS